MFPYPFEVSNSCLNGNKPWVHLLYALAIQDIHFLIKLVCFLQVLHFLQTVHFLNLEQTAIMLVFVIKVSLYRVTSIPGNACAKMDGLALGVRV